MFSQTWGRFGGMVAVLFCPLKLGVAGRGEASSFWGEPFERGRRSAKEEKQQMQYFLTLLVIGIIVGWLAGVITRGGGFGLIGDIVVAVIGAYLGSFIFSWLGIVVEGWAGVFIRATVGAVVFLLVIRLIRRI